MKSVTPEGDVALVRQHARQACRLHAALQPAEEIRDQVRFAPAHAKLDGSVPAVIVDLSAGGASVETGVFVPRGCPIELRVPRPQGGSELLLSGVVRSVRMIDRSPRYRFGVELIGDRSTRDAMVEEMVQPGVHARDSGGPVPEQGGASAARVG